MKKLLALLLAALVLVSVPVALAIQFPRQVDPATAPVDPAYGQGLYVFYGSIVAALSGGNYSAAKALIAQTSFIHIPPEILDAVNSFNGLVNSTSNLFTVINSQLINASGYISTGRIELARSNLTGAVSNLRVANQTLTQLFSAEPQLAAMAGIPSSLLSQKLQPLETVYKGDSAQADRLLAVVTGLTKFEATATTLAVGQSTIEVGSNVTVSGELTGPSGAPLASRNVTIFFQGKPIGTTPTDGAGRYSAQLPTPFFYQQNASMFASFLPAGNDSLVYAPSTSPPVNVTVSFVTPAVSFAAPDTVYAGQPFTINGTLSLAGAPLKGYTVTLSGFRETALGPLLTADALTGPDGSFSVTLTPPTSIEGGSYPLSLKTSSDLDIGPAVISFHVDLVKETPAVTSSVPGLALAGLPITISGTASVNGTGVAGAQVLNTSPSPTVDAKTSSSGAFSFTVIPPLTTANGAWAYTVEVYPAQTWITPAPLNVSVFVINPLVLIFPASSLGLLGLVVRRRRPPAMAPAQALVRAVEATPKKPKPHITTGLPGVYFEAVGLVERATAVPLLPQATIREYLGQVRGVLKGFEHFRYISSELEKHLYAGGAATADEAKARAELESMRREIES